MFFSGEQPDGGQNELRKNDNIKLLWSSSTPSGCIKCDCRPVKLPVMAVNYGLPMTGTEYIERAIMKLSSTFKKLSKARRMQAHVSFGSLSRLRLR